MEINLCLVLLLINEGFWFESTLHEGVNWQDSILQKARPFGFF